jgi:small subunit ribosomal protein S15
MITAEKKRTVVENFKTHQGDTGSPEVQVALLTERINEITEHLKVHKKDYCSRRGLLMLVGRRNALLKYIARKDQKRYESLISRLGLRR